MIFKMSGSRKIRLTIICFSLIFSVVPVSGSSSNYKYLGCYSDSTDLKSKTMTLDSLTLDGCAEMCQRSGYPYAGLQSIKTCYCGMVYDLIGKSSKDCNYTSCGTDTPHCGGYLANDVYYSVDTSSSKNLVRFSTAQSFSKARMTCVGNAGDLACPYDSTINANIMAVAKNDSSITKVWIGLYRKEESNTSANYYWTDETLSAFATGKSQYLSYWADGDTLTNPCVSLDVNSGKWSSTDCNTALPFVCKQPTTAPVDSTTDSSAGTDNNSDSASSNSKRLALFIVLPLFILCYGGSCILYCVHKIIKNCNKKKHTKMNLSQVEDGQKGIQPVPAARQYRPLSAGKRVAVYPAPQPNPAMMGMPPMFIADSDIKKKLGGDMPGKSVDDGLATARGVKLAMDDQSPPPVYTDRQEEKRARLLENASRESRMRREKEVEEGRAPSRPFTAPKRPQPPHGNEDGTPGDDSLADSQGSTTKLLGKDKKPEGPDGGATGGEGGGSSEDRDQGNTPINEILKMKVAQKADKKRARKIVAA